MGRLTVRYIDHAGREQTLTHTQLIYLREAERRNHIEFGWGGFRSTITVRILQERGLLYVSTRHHASSPWCITGVTSEGRAVMSKMDD